MPTPGAEALETAITGFTITVADGVTTEFKAGPVSAALAEGMDAGWTCATPTTVSTMAATIGTAFADIAAGQGLASMVAIGTAIDAETAAWASSWNSTAQVHSYAPDADTISAAAVAASPVKSPGFTALAEAVAAAFVANFVQEVG